MNTMTDQEVACYWRDKEFKKWVVILGNGNTTDRKYVRARTETGAIGTGVFHSLLRGRVSARARLANPVTDLCAIRRSAP